VRVDIQGRNVEITDEIRESVRSRFSRVSRQVSELATLEVVIWEERNPSIADCHVVEANLRVKGATLHAKESEPELIHAIHHVAEDIRRQVKRHREKRLARPKPSHMGAQRLGDTPA
jgi:putative sigma-54 modulation protein